MPDDRPEENLKEILERWWQRFQFAIGFWHEPPQERFREHYETFNDLIAIIVTASFIETLLYIGVQFTGFDVKAGERKRITLWPLIGEAKERAVIDETLAKLLYLVNDMRNGAAHDPDYKLTNEVVQTLYDRLPQSEKNALQPAFRNILPEPTMDIVARLTFERILSMAYAAVAAAQERMLDEP